MKIVIIVIGCAIGFVVLMELHSQPSARDDREQMRNPNDNQNNYSDDQDSKRIELLSSEPESDISGEFIKAFLKGYEAFIKDTEIPASKKRLEHYTIEFRQDNEFYYVTFAGKGPPSPGYRGGESKVSRSVLYTISKKKYRMISRKFFR